MPGVHRQLQRSESLPSSAVAQRLEFSGPRLFLLRLKGRHLHDAIFNRGVMMCPTSWMMTQASAESK